MDRGMKEATQTLLLPCLGGGSQACPLLKRVEQIVCQGTTVWGKLCHQTVCGLQFLQGRAV